MIGSNSSSYTAVGVVSYLVIIILICVTAPINASRSVGFRLKNSSDQLISLWWIDPDSLKYVSQSEPPGIYPQAYLNINSFHTHRFAVVEETGDCIPRRRDDGEYLVVVDPQTEKRYCYESRFVVTDAPSQFFKVVGEGETFKILVVSEETMRAAELDAFTEECLKSMMSGEGKAAKAR